MELKLGILCDANVSGLRGDSAHWQALLSCVRIRCVIRTLHTQKSSWVFLKGEEAVNMVCRPNVEWWAVKLSEGW